MAEVLINGRAYDHSQITVVYGGVQLVSVTSLDYGEEQEKGFNLGSGTRPVSYGQGGITASGTIELSMNDVEAIREAAPGGSLLQLALNDMVVVHGNPQSPQTHVIKNLAWTTDKPSSAQGDTDIKVTLDFIASDIKWR